MCFVFFKLQADYKRNKASRYAKLFYYGLILKIPAK